MDPWVQALVLGASAAVIAVALIKRIRRKERADLDYPEIILTDTKARDGRDTGDEDGTDSDAKDSDPPGKDR